MASGIVGGLAAALRLSVGQSRYTKTGNGFDLRVTGNVALLKFYGTIGGGSWDSVTASWKVPEQYRPPMTLYVPLGCTNGASGTGQLMVGADGTLRAGNQGGAGSADERWGAVTWCVAL